jgi:hypothetical protein
MQEEVDDPSTSEVRVASKALLKLTRENGVGLIAWAVHLSQLFDVLLPPTPLALLRLAGPGKPGLTPFLLALRPFLNFLVGWLSGHDAHPFLLSVGYPSRHNHPYISRQRTRYRQKLSLDPPYSAAGSVRP